GRGGPPPPPRAPPRGPAGAAGRAPPGGRGAPPGPPPPPPPAAAPARRRAAPAGGVPRGRGGRPRGGRGAPPPQLPLLVRARLPGVLEHLVRVEGLALVEQPLRLGDTLRGGPHDALGLPRHALRAVRQGPSEPVTGPGVARPALAVAVPRGVRPARHRDTRAVRPVR